MEIQFTPEVEPKIQPAAAEHSSSADTYVQQLVEQHLDHDSWFRQRAKRGIEQMDRGEFLTHEEVGARIEKMLRS
jgi:predicted transcriptional regulator